MRNLDEDFPGVVTTVEWMGKEICDGLYEHLCASKLPRLKSIDVNVRESDVASAAYSRIYHADTSEYSVRATDRLLVGHKAPDGNSISGSTMIVHLRKYFGAFYTYECTIFMSRKIETSNIVYLFVNFAVL